MLRYILLIVTIVGLGAGVGVWIVSYSFDCGFAISRAAVRNVAVLAAIDGRVRISVIQPMSTAEVAVGWDIGPLNGESAAWFAPKDRPVFYYMSGGPFHMLAFPAFVLLAPFVLLLGVLSMPWWRRLRRRRRGCCVACGYDLTGNVSGACPECGADVAARDANLRGVD